MLLFWIGSGLRVAALAGVLFAGGVGAAAAEQLGIDKLRITRDSALNKARWVCVTDQVPAMLAEIRARGFVTETPERHCEVAAEEAARRGIADALYARFEAGEPRAVWLAVVHGALEGQGRFIAPNGQQFGLTCPLAFEAGYRFGVEYPEKQVGGDVTDIWVRDALVRCFEPGSTLARSDGMVVGAKLGQAFAKRHAALAAR